MSTKKNVPEIRFMGFSGDWEEKVLGIIADIKTGPFGSSLHAEDYVEDGEPIITTEHFKSGILPKNKIGIPQVNNKDYSRLKAYFLHLGDIVFSRVGSVDINAHVTSNQKGWLFSGRVLRVRTTNSIDSEFLHHELSTSRVKKSVVSRAVGQTMPSINTEILKITPVYLPVETTEQTKIGNYFQQLDSLIAQHQQKYDKLLNLKKSLLEKMFPKQGATVPDIRFKGFSGEWKEKELGEIFTYERPDKYIVKSVEYSDKYDTPVLTANKGFLLGYTNEKATFDMPSIIFDDFTLNCKYVDFFYMVKSSAIKILTIKDDKKDDLFFSFNLLNTTKIDVMGHARHYIGVVQNTNVTSPKKKEQTKIGNLFKQLDTLLTQHQAQLKKLNNIKQACLEKMFV